MTPYRRFMIDCFKIVAVLIVVSFVAGVAIEAWSTLWYGQ